MRYLLADLRAFGAGVRREMREMRRYPFLTIGLLFWPVMLPSVYVFMGRVYSGGNDPRAIQAFAERSGTADVTGFVFVGFAMFMWLSIILWGPGTALRRQQVQGQLEAVYLTPASRLIVLFAPSVAQFYAIALSFGVMALAMWILFGVTLDPLAVARALVVLAIAMPALFAVGSLFAAAVLRFGEVNAAVHFVRGALVLLSGITFPLVMLPEWARAVATVVPTTHIVGGLRRVLLTDTPIVGVAEELRLIVGLAAAFGLIAVVIYRWTESYARKTGALSRY